MACTVVRGVSAWPSRNAPPPTFANRPATASVPVSGETANDSGRLGSPPPVPSGAMVAGSKGNTTSCKSFSAVSKRHSRPPPSRLRQRVTTTTSAAVQARPRASGNPNASTTRPPSRGTRASDPRAESVVYTWSSPGRVTTPKGRAPRGSGSTRCGTSGSAGASTISSASAPRQATTKPASSGATERGSSHTA
jgi:hypothetical protein